MYQQYEAVLEGSAERILSMAEKEQQHRIDWESKALKAASGETVCGQWLGFVVVIICLGSTVFLSAHGHQWVAAVIAGSCTVGLVGRFLQGRSSGDRVLSQAYRRRRSKLQDRAKRESLRKTGGDSLGGKDLWQGQTLLTRISVRTACYRFAITP